MPWKKYPVATILGFNNGLQIFYMLLKPLIATKIIILSFFSSARLNAQDNNLLRMEFAPVISYAKYDYDPAWGYGAHVKLLCPVGREDNSVTPGVYFDRLSMKNYDNSRSSYSFLHGTVGFRKRFNSFFIEPVIGFGYYVEKGDYFESYKSTSFLFGIEPGIQKDNLTFSISYRSLIADGFIFGEHFSVFGLKVGFLLFNKSY